MGLATNISGCAQMDIDLVTPDLQDVDVHQYAIDTEKNEDLLITTTSSRSEN